MTMHRPLALAAAALLSLSAACGSSSTPSSPSTPPSASASPPAPATAGLTLEEGWVKATEGMGGGMAEMTGAFGILRNAGTQPLHVTGGWSPAAGRVELHETVKNASGVDIAGIISASPIPFDFDYDGDTLGGTAGTDKAVTLIGIKPGSGKLAVATGTLTRSEAISLSLVGEADRAYN